MKKSQSMSSLLCNFTMLLTKYFVSFWVFWAMIPCTVYQYFGGLHHIKDRDNTILWNISNRLTRLCGITAEMNKIDILTTVWTSSQNISCFYLCCHLCVLACPQLPSFQYSCDPNMSKILVKTLFGNLFSFCLSV